MILMISDCNVPKADTHQGVWLLSTNLRSKVAVKQLENKLGIHPGIVVGRLQHDGLIKASWMNDLKVSFCVKSANNT